MLMVWEIDTLEPDLSISLEKFHTDEDANCIGGIVFNATKILSESFNLDISKLKKIVISYDFGTALQQVKSGYNHESPSSFTNSRQSTAIGQLVSKIGSNGLCDEYTLVLSVNFFVELFNEKGEINVKDEGVRAVIHRLHHELVHIHEKNTLICLDQSFRVNDYGDALLTSATRAWSEYFANYMSSRSAPKEIVDDFLDNLEIVINEVQNEIDNFVWDYKNHIIELDTMFYEVKKRINLIINSYGYAIGYVHALDINLEIYHPKLSVTLSGSKLKESLISLSKAFEDLMEKYNDNKIKNHNDFCYITEAIDTIYKKFGLILECTDWSTESELYIHVS
ncbi:hypothetical protein [Serratia fonticola]|uniref:hypothetical protein n=1 Tax=Serratia fonticola TaxID=47917 RepID=UPI001ED8F27F|nr:hypothetical protein [Serratia fonticola]